MTTNTNTAAANMQQNIAASKQMAESRGLTFGILAEKRDWGQMIWLNFGSSSANDRKVVDVLAQLEEIPNGGVVSFNGPCSWIVAVALGHAVSHRFQSVLCYEPPVNGYVVTIEHGSNFSVGQVIPADPKSGEPILT